MRVLVIPDIHLKPWIFDRTEKILRDGKADRAVCLMDMPDDWNMEFQIERYKETFDRAIAFAEDYPDRGVRPFFSDKFDITKHKQYPLLSDYDKKNEFDIEKYVKNRNRLRFKRNDVVDEVCDVGEIAE